jgi:hypothetical protein
MPADAAPADALLVLDFEKFKRRTTVRRTKRPGHFPYTGCVLDISDAKALRPLYSVGATGGNVLIESRIDLADRRLKKRLLAIA